MQEGLSAENLSYSLLDCYQKTLERSETLGIRQEDLKKAQAQYWQAVAAILPQVDLVATEEISNVALNSSGRSSLGAASAGRKDRFSASFQARQRIFSGFREWNAAAGIKAEERSKVALIEREKQLLYLNTSDLFYQILSYEKDLQLLEEIQQTLQNRCRELQERIALGRSRKSELLAAQTDLAENRTTVEQVKGLWSATRELFAFLTGIPSEQLSLKNSTELPPLKKLEDYLLKSGSRSDVVASAEEKTIAQRDLSVSRGDFFPTLDVTGTHELWETPHRQQDWSLVLTAELPLFDGGTRIAQMKEKEAMLRTRELHFSKARRLVESEVRQNYNQYIALARQWVELSQAVEISQKNYEAQKEDYRLGRSSNLDVLQALLSLSDLRRRLNSVEYQNKASLNSLFVAAGQGFLF